MENSGRDYVFQRLKLREVQKRIGSVDRNTDQTP